MANRETTTLKTVPGTGMSAGLFVAAMVTAALIAILYFAWTVIGLPFASFDIFDWLTRVLPGSVIAAGIHTMVAVIRALHLGSTTTEAKVKGSVLVLLC